MTKKGAIAAGHPETISAAALILEDGGNAFDAALAAFCAACVAEPVLASLGGGGFMLARPIDGFHGREAVLYDFFTQTPKVARPKDDIDFFPIMADFGTTRQEFHIGMGSIATPGAIKGLFDIHQDLGRLPMTRIVEPAVELARRGVPLNPLQAFVFSVVEKIYIRDPRCRAIFGSRRDAGKLAGEGEIISIPEMGDALYSLAREGSDLFYRGEIARSLTEACRTSGGHLTMDDMEAYRTIRRPPLETVHGKARLLTNPPPSSAGILAAFALELLKDARLGDMKFGSAQHLKTLAAAMAATNKAQVDAHLHKIHENEASKIFLAPAFVQAYRRQVLGRPAFSRGTTHISVIDFKGNAAAMTLSNGEGSGYILPGAGVMTNNMLGEKDTNPHGLQRWPTDIRLSSMMAPTVALKERDELMALGSGGSSRIRTAILQVLLGHLDFGMEIGEAVNAPRIHYEKEQLNVEPGYSPEVLKDLAGSFPGMLAWDEKNLFFGGVHAVSYDWRGPYFDGAGDPRRGGAILTL